MADDDLRLEDITPEDLGCMGEQEVAPGVKEETVGDKPQPISPCFEHIPFEKRKQYRKFYDEFFTAEGKDMPFEEFAVEMYAAQHPTLMHQDLNKIIGQKHVGYQRKAAIKHTLSRMN